MPDVTPNNLTPDSMLGHYRILEKIGSGGMGEVYLALDTKLERRVAVKVLPADVATNVDRVRRFFQEAKAASALNHPHIAHIYEIGESKDGTSFIAMEYVDGATLTAKIHKDRTDLLTLLKYLEQTAEGLAKAHAAGIVHRDLKPDNIIVSRDGYAKILDFGIAKLLEPSVPFDEANTALMERPLSIPGTVIGTAGYMSPEQARGAANIDQRSDIFSLGCILYEAATGGRRPFEGETLIDALHSILRDQPVPLKEINPKAPADLQRITRRCLQKDPDDRYQSIKDVAIELRELRSDMKATSPSHSSDLSSADPAMHLSNDRSTMVGSRPVVTSVFAPTTGAETAERIPRSGSLFSTVFWGAIVLFAIVAGGFGVYKFFGFGGDAGIGTSFKVTPLTSSPIIERNPALSPDGKQFAYVYLGEKDNNFDIYVKITDAGSPIRLTTNPAKDMSPTWSPDGRFIAFLRSDGPDKGIYTIPALGGAERKITDVYGWSDAGIRPQAVDWSPDGKVLAIVDKDGDGRPWSVYLISIETGERRKLTNPPDDYDGDTFTAFSPDGESVAFLRRRDAGYSDIFTVPIAGGEPFRVTADGTTIRGLDWTSDSERIVFSSERSGGSPTLWTISATGGAVAPVAGTGDDVSELTVSPRGNRLIYSRFALDVNLWRLEIPGRQSGVGSQTSTTRFVASNRFEGDPSYSFDGKKIAFSSDRSGSVEIWVCNSDGENPVQITSFGSAATTGSPRWSPDGRLIVFDSRAEGKADIYVIGAEGGSPKRLTTDAAEDVIPTWSADGRYIYFASRRSGRFEVWKMPASGGDAVQITHDGGFVTAESADGKTLYYTKGGPDLGLWEIGSDGGSPAKLLALNLGRNWALTDKGVYFFSLPPEELGPYSLEFFDIANRQRSRIGSLQGPARLYSVNVITISPDNRQIVYSQRDQLDFDLMLVENFH